MECAAYVGLAHLDVATYAISRGRCGICTFTRRFDGGDITARRESNMRDRSHDAALAASPVPALVRTAAVLLYAGLVCDIVGGMAEGFWLAVGNVLV